MPPKDQDALFQYKCTDYYYPQYEHSLRYDDKDIAIVWPDTIEISLSEKDKDGQTLVELKNNGLLPRL